MSLQPLEDRIVVRSNEAESTTASGLVIPDTAKEKPQEGKVLAVGPGRFDEDGEKRIPPIAMKRVEDYLDVVFTPAKNANWNDG